MDLREIGGAIGPLASPQVDPRSLVHAVSAKQLTIWGPLSRHTMDEGTGIDLWRGQRADGSPYLAEVHYIKKGRPHGFEWWINENQRTVHWERLWREGLPHGIERQWTSHRLDRGYPRFHLRGKRVSKAEYVKACAKDKSLPAYHHEDDSQERIFPKDIRRKLRFPRPASPPKS